MPAYQKALAIGCFALIIGLAFPTYITAANTTQTTSIELSSGGSDEFIDGLEATADAVNSSGANVTLTDLESYQDRSVNLTTGDTANLTLQGEAVNVTVDSTDTSPTLNQTVLSIDHPRDYGWSSGAKTITDSIGIILAIITLIIGSGLIMKVMI
jgi:hypothetical protein